jgi:hypothetical protein
MVEGEVSCASLRRKKEKENMHMKMMRHENDMTWT